MGIEEIRKKYISKQNEANLAAQREVLNRSFEDYQNAHKDDGDMFIAMQALYEDATTLYQEEDVEEGEKQQLLYLIYEAFYEKLGSLSWKKRRRCRADKHIVEMRVCLKKGQKTSATLRYWIDFAKYVVPWILVFFSLEMAFFSLLKTAPVWQPVLILIGFFASFMAYCLAAYHFEGRRLFGTLQTWIRFRQSPKEYNRPMDVLQGIKMMIPLLVALGGALIKIYVR